MTCESNPGDLELREQASIIIRGVFRDSVDTIRSCRELPCMFLRESGVNAATLATNTHLQIPVP